MTDPFQRFRSVRRALRRVDPLVQTGRSVVVTPFLVTGRGTGSGIGELVEVETRGGTWLPAEVVSVRGDGEVLLPLGDAAPVLPGGRVRRTGRPLRLRVGYELLGRVLDGLGCPLDGRPLPPGMCRWEVDRPAPSPLERPRLHRPFLTGVRAIDAFTSLAEGQRIGLFAGPGAGKSTLLGSLARGSGTSICVVGLVGERGREVRDLVEEGLGPEGMRRSVVVAATSDAPAVVRMRAAHVATAIAEWFARERGETVLLLVDSLTRFARAVREVGLGAGEAPVRQGFPARVFSELPRLVERAGTGPGGTITAIYTVLSSGDAAEDPLSTEILGLLDGHLVLDRKIAESGRHPALDVLASLSRAMPAVTSPAHRAAASRVRGAIARWEAARDILAAGAWVRGSEPGLDAAVDAMPAIENFLRQDLTRPTGADETIGRLAEIAERVAA